ncbi:MAG: rhodanese-like domain-containing protein [Acidobacteriota bacterium]|nr:rhodanese-like domain-containing protein [Acidobacteriota bacterium]
MNNAALYRKAVVWIALISLGLLAVMGWAQTNPAASTIDAAHLISPQDLVKALQSGSPEKPLVINVGFHVLYTQAHIPGSEYIGPASSLAGLQQLHKRVEPLSRKQSIVLYCGCCPWSHCPNVGAAFKELAGMGFTNLKVVYLPDNFGTNWVDKGFPVLKGE